MNSIKKFVVFRPLTSLLLASFCSGALLFIGFVALVGAMAIAVWQ